ncbi:outer membrane protein, TIGR04327 family [Leptospira weilii serovar Ranarum str. ICFT]|uniref:Outer membrane protein, TIGR04327 family n=1 Tax=Leptospira weilii serovar Ranarum str. ICFT TaxID=1218598 RepID=N1WC03_9LEPT|nr:hypothetical protein [Leptospira weilii]EMY77796.1 outer membrane protein, TIGR04327 family [Leptospira weilii serovar Ranarum str. ICFT]
MKKSIIILCYLFSISISAQTESQKTNETDSNTGKTEIGIRVQRSIYTPSEYNRILNFSNGRINNYSELHGNQKTIVPFYIRHFDSENRYGFEFQFTRNSLYNANYTNFYVSASDNGSYRNYLYDTERTDYKFNYFRLDSTPKAKLFYWGAGLRKIDKIKESSSRFLNMEEKIISYGIQLVARSNLNLYKNLDLNLGLDIYYTQGQRNYYYQSGYNVSINDTQFIYVFKVFADPKTIGVFRGAEADVSLSYLLSNRYKFYFGFSYNRAYFRYRNFSDYSLTYLKDQIGYTQYYDNGAGKEDIKGFYLGVSAVF